MCVVSRLAGSLAALLFIAQPGAPQSPDPQQTGVGRVSGRVATPSAELVADAAVTLVGGPPPGRVLTARTDERGEFAFTGLAGGEYVLSAAKPGYTIREIDERGILRSPFTFKLADAEQSAGLELTMRRAGSIAGRVVQPDGTPAAGVQVLVGLRDDDRLTLLHEDRTFSEWDGRYEIIGLPPGEFLVVVMPAPPGNPAPSSKVDVPTTPLVFEPTIYPGVPQSEPGETVRVYEGRATEGIDVWLPPAPQRFAVSGRLFWPDALDVDNLVIEYGGSRDVRSGVWYVDDPGGLFTIEGVSQGTLVMLARADSSRGPLIGFAVTEVALGPVEEVRLTLGEPGSVEGRLRYTSPPPPATIPRVSLVQRLLDVSPLYPAEEATPDRDGRFRIPHALGEYTFEVHGLPADWTVRHVHRGGRVIRDSRLVIARGEVVTALEIVVGPPVRPAAPTESRQP